MKGSPEPQVLLWHKVYCALMTLIYVASILLGAGLMLFANRIADARNPEAQFIVQGFVMAAMGSVFAAAFFASFFLPRAPWAWVYHIVLISLGLTSCCCLPASVPLLIFWLKPETQGYFGRKAQASPETTAQTQKESELPVEPMGEVKDSDESSPPENS